jgi:hypothetical protein
MSGLVATMRITPEVSEYMESNRNFHDDFLAKAKDTHLKWVFLTLEYIQKYSRVDTGRSRAAWTPIMDVYGYDYQRSMPMGPRQDASAVMQGKNEGTYLDQDFHTEIVNNVGYVEPMNRIYGLFGFAPSRSLSRKGLSKKLHPVKLAKGIRLEEKIPLFESFAQTIYERFTQNAVAAFEKRGLIDPVIPDPPQGF